ncbi:formylglycine-generating enzyme family protein [Aquimarina algiphila]|uniref:formylglycine-generating enzyme family protein n=1 Tax=Aquimarina algiphila TaxID=2047982 RepID=UPI00232C47A9|nr:formylglycine-generating enzyme family protein [Aquimarina algiphila]
MMDNRWMYIVLSVVFVLISCKNKKDANLVSENKSDATKAPSPETSLIKQLPKGIKTPKGMVWITGGTFYQGAVPEDTMAMNHEKPRHKVAVDGFFMDTTEITNKQFAKFVQETGYITTAEKEIDWDEMKKQLPEGTPRPHDSIMQPGSLVFTKTNISVSNFQDYSQWWKWTINANWKHPYGPGSSIQNKENYPAIHIAHEDAEAYCKWAGRRLPTEAEWEYAARGVNKNSIFFWGDDGQLKDKANTWTGEFPVTNDKADGYERQAAVGSYPPNSFGLYDMSGNVWEWTSDWYNTEYYKEVSTVKDLILNPKGATEPYNAANPYAREIIIKGGSFLCSVSYCASYRLSARMSSSHDSSTDHLGFRTVVDLKMLSTAKN